MQSFFVYRSIWSLMKSNALLQPTIAKLILTPRRKNKPLRSGYGACSSSGCNCKSYEGSGSTCENCGHNYDRHW
jgi:hypothetical protein